LEYLFSRVSINKLLWFIAILVSGTNIFLLSPFKIGETSIPITFCISILGMILYFGILAKRKTIRFKLISADYALLIYFIINIISTVVNSFRNNYVYFAHNINGLLLLFAGIVYYFFIRVCVGNYKQTVLLFKVYFFSALIPSIYSILHFITWETGNPFLFKMNYDLYSSFYRSNIFRASGFTPEPSHFAIYLSGVIFIGLFFLFKKKNQKSTKRLVVSLIIISIALLLTFSQIIYIDLIFFFWFLIIIKGKNRSKYFLIVLFLLIFFVIYGLDITFNLGGIQLLNERKQALLGTIKGESNIGRVQSIEAGLEIFKKSPIIGVGLNNVDLQMIKRAYKGEYIGGHTGIHSKFVTILMEAGIIGFFIYFGFATKVILKRINLVDIIKLPNNISYVFFVIFILTGITGRFGTFFFFWFLAAITVNYNMFYRSPSNKEKIN